MSAETAGPPNAQGGAAAADLPEIEEENCILPFPLPGSAEEVSEQSYDVAIPTRPFIDSFRLRDRAQAFQEALATLPPPRDVHRMELSAAVNFASAGKPVPLKELGPHAPGQLRARLYSYAENFAARAPIVSWVVRVLAR